PCWRRVSAGCTFCSEGLSQGGMVARHNSAAVQKPAPSTPVQPVVPDLDRLIHEKVRLGIVSALAANESLSFNDLKKLLNTTDGNLSVHARRLEDAKYVTCTKTFEGRM